MTRLHLQGLFALFIFACLPLISHAQDQTQSIQVLLSDAPGAPTPDDVVTYFNTLHSGTGGHGTGLVRPPPLESLSVEDPQQALYLIPGRAEGDFLAYLEANPDSVRAKLERYIVVQYPPDADISDALSALNSDPYVEAAFLPLTWAFSSAQSSGSTITGSTHGFTPLTAGTQYGRDALNIDQAWQLAGGYALVGDLDTGLYVNHPAFQQFSPTGQYLGGNYIPAASLNVGNLSGVFDSNIDEEFPIALPLDSVCNPNHQPLVSPSIAGHGTHVSGLIAANARNNSFGLNGTCKNCGIAQWKITFDFCAYPSIYVYADPNPDAVPIAIRALSETGAQVINMSLGTDPPNPRYYFDGCENYPLFATCLAIAEAKYRGVAIVAASGNNLDRLQFPASDPRVISVGGLDSSLAFWDESPGNCPYGADDSRECGSNYTVNPGDPKQELMAPAKSVLSTTYPNLNWNPEIKCGDQFPGPGFGGGQGLCTGTSMSSPQVAGVVGILRSINPLVLPSNPELSAGDVTGIRTVLAQTTFEAQEFLPWSNKFGYGRPDAAAAARRMLGTVAGVVVKNRVTPLFRMYSPGATDYADTTSPQTAIALNIYEFASYAPQGPLVTGYPGFPNDEPGVTPIPAPRAAVYVLTTEYKPWPQYPDLIPLYMVSRKRNWPLGCTTEAGCNTNHRDYTLMTTTADVEQAHADGYDLRIIQGYVYQTCSPEPQCIPPAAQKFYRECNTSNDDCATFLESERITFEANGYTTAYPAGSSKLLGYAYPSTDSDGDGLVDGFEYVIGTNPNRADSNGDGTADGVAFPAAGVPVSDPCSSGSLTCPSDLIITKTHSGNFSQGQIGATYALTVSNISNSATSGGVTVTDTLPSGLTRAAISGTGWACTLATLTCTRSNTLPAGSSYPVIVVTVNVDNNASASLINNVAVSGGGDVTPNNNSASDLTFIVPKSNLTIAKTHIGNFSQGQTGATYTLTITNSGFASATGLVTVSDSLPTGLTATAISGTGWTCTLSPLACTRSDALASGSSYPAITVTVNVVANAPASVTNSATVASTGGATSSNTANDATTIVPKSNLTIAKTHTGSFSQGQTGATYTLAVSNSGFASATGLVTVSDSLPTGLTATAISGTGWTCTLSPLACTRSDALASGSSYPAITVTVSVAANAPASVTNSATVASTGGATSSNTANDATTIVSKSNLTIAKTHTGSFSQGQTGATYTLAVSNSGFASATGLVTVSDSLPTGLTATAISGTGWTCTLSPLACTRSDALASGGSYPAITVTVNVAANAPASLTNSATVAGTDGATSSNTANDATTIVPVADLTITKTHSGNFTQGHSAVYTLLVSNVGFGTTSGTVSVTDSLPPSLTVRGISGSGWACTAGTTPTCTNSNDLKGGYSYPPITLTVFVASNAPSNVTNTATVSGGGDISPGNNLASDPTTILPFP